MKHKGWLVFFIMLIACMTLCSCGDVDTSSVKEEIQSLYGENQTVTYEYDSSLAADCVNGTFLGREENGVVSYKGIPYAKPPVGSLRWKAPVLAEADDGVYEAYYYGKSPIQTEWPSEVGSYYPQSEDCLTLNVWTSNTVDTDKTVMVFFHGGSFGWGAVSDPLYDGQNFVEAHPDVVLVTVEYRTGIMGFMDFSSVEGGEAYAESGNLGLLDMVCGLKWVQQNISAFGGDSNSVTIFGESAGGAAVSLLPLIDDAKGLFQRVIAESGAVNLTFSKEECRRLTDMLLEETGATSMKELLALSEEELMEVNESLNDYNNFPERDGVVLPENLYEAYEKGEASDVDLLIGTNADEVRYWINEMDYEVPGVSGSLIYKLAFPVMFQSDTKQFSKEDKERLQNFMALQHDKRIWNISEFYTEVLFRVPSLYQAEANAKNGGNAYVYYWNYPSAIGELKACHAVELAYVFNNLEETIYTGDNIDAGLAAEVQEMWVNFAKTGNPSTEQHEWSPYSKESRTTMVLDSDIHEETDLLEDQRILVEPLLKYNLNGTYTNLDYAVPIVFLYVFILLLAVAFLVLICVAVVKLVRKRKTK